MIRVLLTALCGVLLATTTFAAEIRVKQGELTAEARLTVARLEKMSQTVELTLIVEGPAPLEVTVPKPLLITPNEWRVFDVELPLREVLPNGRQRWQRRYQLSPLKLGSVAVRPAAFTIRAGQQADTKLDWGEESLHVTVNTSVKNATIDSLRDPTTMEELPPAVTVEHHERSWFIAVVPICLLLAAILLVASRRTRQPSVVHDAAWALAELHANPSADHCAWVIREYVGARLGVDVRACTTAELLAKIPPEMPWSDHHEGVRQILHACDVARFSGEPSTQQHWLEPTQAWLRQVEDALQPSSTEMSKEVRRGE